MRWHNDIDCKQSIILFIVSVIAIAVLLTN